MDLSKVLLSRQFILLLVASMALGWLCYDGLDLMANWWNRDEYSHGPMIPFVAAYLLFQKRFTLAAAAQPGSFFGVLVLMAAVVIWLMGELSAIYTLTQYAFLIGIFGLGFLWVGVSGMKVIWAALLYLVFMIPLPNFLFFNLSQELQLISSSLGVAVIRFFDISVYLEGNVIDLGVYKLQVVEACNGLRYLFPLMSFGYLIAYIYRGPVWHKLTLFLSTIPITVLMNSFRIGVIGVTVEYFGIQAAEGFLHDFEGWILFMACLGVLFVEMSILRLFLKNKPPLAQTLDLDFGRHESEESNIPSHLPMSKAAYVGLFVLIAAIPMGQYVADRQDIVPNRLSFNHFPLAVGSWIGREESISEGELEVLRLTDYLKADFRSIDRSQPNIDLYTAWYQEQRKGSSIHSPKSCLPGGGWEIKKHTIESLPNIDAFGAALKVNRIVMQLGESRQLVYYWFQGRHRNITNEYMAKWYIFWDSLTRQRTDGALMRVVTPVPEGSDIKDADSRLNSFVAEIYPSLSTYIPD